MRWVGHSKLAERRAALVLAAIMLIALLSAATDLAAQQKSGDAALAIAYPPAFGLQLHLRDWLAVRPEVSTFVSSSESSLGTLGSVETDTWTTTVGVTVLFRLRSDGGLAYYVAPRLAYVRDSVTRSNGPGAPEDITRSGFEIGGSFGVQFALNKKLSLFGETGVVHNRTDVNDTARLIGGQHSSATGNRTAGGLLLYF